MIVVIRVLFRVLVGGGDGGQVLLDLPDGAAAPLGSRAPAARLGHPGVGARRALRRAPARRHRDLRRRGATPWPTPSACSARCRRPSTRSAARSSSRSPCCPHLAESLRRVRAAQTLRGGDERPGARAAAAARTGARGLARAVARAGRRDGHARLRPVTAGATAARAPYDRRPDAARALRDLRRRLRRPRPDHAALGRARPMLALGVVVSLVAVRGAGRRVGRYPLPPGSVAVAGGRGRRVRRVVALAVWWMSHHQLAIAYPGADRRAHRQPGALLAAGVAPRWCAVRAARPRSPAGVAA